MSTSSPWRGMSSGIRLVTRSAVWTARESSGTGTSSIRSSRTHSSPSAVQWVTFIAFIWALDRRPRSNA